MREILSTPLFGIFISIMAYEVGVLLNRKFRSPLINPLLIGQLIIITVLIVGKLDYSNYKVGGDYISFFLGPATVILAVPIYKKIELLKRDFIPIIAGIVIGSIAGMMSIIAMARLFNMENELLLSLLPKSVTTPIGVEVSNQIHGIPSITIIGIVITGILGAVFSDKLCSLFKIKDEVAVGVGIGTASHALGTTKALEMGETEGALSGLSIGIAGIITVILAPVIVHLFGY